LQAIIIEQLAKIIAASSRSVWTDLRERSGTLPSGRTVLGTLVDPLGFWRTSPIVRMNELDTKTVETTRNLIALLQEQVQSTSDDTSSGAGDTFDLSTLSPEETLELSSILVNKVWARRIGVVKTSNRLAQQLLKLTADKLERGEREVLRLPEGAEDSETQLLESSSRSATTTSSNKKVLGSTRSSDRLKGARQLLEELETTDSPMLTTMAQEEEQIEKGKESATESEIKEMMAFHTSSAHQQHETTEKNILDVQQVEQGNMDNVDGGHHQVKKTTITSVRKEITYDEAAGRFFETTN